jgi:hypothetical protein
MGPTFRVQGAVPFRPIWRRPRSVLLAAKKRPCPHTRTNYDGFVSAARFLDGQSAPQPSPRRSVMRPWPSADQRGTGRRLGRCWRLRDQYGDPGDAGGTARRAHGANHPHRPPMPGAFTRRGAGARCATGPCPADPGARQSVQLVRQVDGSVMARRCRWVKWPSCARI